MVEGVSFPHPYILPIVAPDQPYRWVLKQGKQVVETLPYPVCNGNEEAELVTPKRRDIVHKFEGRCYATFSFVLPFCIL